MCELLYVEDDMNPSASRAKRLEREIVRGILHNGNGLLGQG